jgi:DMSO/TMAO reductase YedYZ molybdopterin-dependent catalytic subunit
MKIRFTKIYYLFVSLLMAGALLTGIAGCKSADTEDTTVDTTTDTTVALTITKDTQTSTYTMKSLKALPSITGWAGQMSSTGKISGPFEYKGVALSELLKAVGGITENNAVRVSAKDGYAMTLSYNQVTNGTGFPVLDSSTGKEVVPSKDLIVFVAYEEDGKPIDDTVGPLRLGIMTSNTQVTDGHWWVKWTQKIEVISTVQPWTLNLEGIVTEKMDQATFESGSAIGCHGVKWTDDQNRVWEGIPLWYLVGRVDDTDTHKGDAFNDAKADAGYEVQLVAADGFTLSLTSAEVKRNDALIVAYKRDGAPLPENQWPLRLVGATLQKSQMVGQIVSIKLVFGEEETVAPPVETAVLTVISGTQTKTYSLAQLKAMTPLDGYAGTKNKAGVITGPLAYKGVALSVLLAEVGGIPAGGSVKFTAADGYSKTLTADVIQNGTFTTYDATGTAVNPEKTPIVFLAYESDGAALAEGTGPVQLAVMTCQEQVTDGSNFVKALVSIEVLPAQ